MSERYKAAAAWLVALLILVMLLLTAQYVRGQPFTIVGDTAFVNDSNAYISATPHTIKGSGDVIIEVEPKVDMPANIAFGFNSTYPNITAVSVWNPRNESVTRSYTCTGNFTALNNPKYFYCHVNGSVVFEHAWETRDTSTKTATWTETVQNNWTLVTNNLGRAKHRFDGKENWLEANNLPLKAGVRYKAKISITVPSLPYGKTQAEAFPDYDGKYDVAFYPASFGNLSNAIAAGQFYYLDPVVNLSNGTVLSLSFDGGSFTDAAGAHTVTNSGTTNTSGKIGDARSFSAPSSVVVTDAADLGLTRYTYSTWLYLTSCADTGTVSYHLTKSLSGAYNYGMYTNSGCRPTAIHLQDVGGNVEVHSNQTVPLNTWTMVTTTYDGSNLRIYVNNNLTGTGGANAPRTNTDAIYIGRFGGGTGYNTLGKQDLIYLANRALNQTEISEKYALDMNGTQYPYETGNPNAAAVISNVSISPAKAFNNQTLVGVCTATDANGYALTYSYRWYKDGALNATTQNITSTGLAKGQAWIFSCMVNNTVGNATSWTNSSSVQLQNRIGTNTWASYNWTFNHNVTSTYISSYCTDPDAGEPVSYASNNTGLVMQSDGRALVNGSITRIGTYPINVTCYDLSASLAYRNENVSAQRTVISYGTTHTIRANAASTDRFCAEEEGIVISYAGHGGLATCADYTGGQWTRNTNCEYVTYLTCGFGAANVSGTTYVTFTNTAPTTTSASLTPSPLPLSSDLSITYTCNDADGDSCATGAQYQWYKNGILLSSTSSTLARGNWTAGDNITGSVRAYDGNTYSAWQNTSTMTTGDTTSPTVTGPSVSPQSPAVNDTMTIGAVCNDLNPVANATLEITDAGSVKANYSMNSSDNVTFTRTYGPPLPGTYTARVYCTDASGNTGSASTVFTVTLTASESGTSTGGGGGGGGSSTTIINNGGASFAFESPLIDQGITWMKSFGEGPVAFEVPVKMSRVAKSCTASAPFTCTIIENGTAVKIGYVEREHDFFSKTLSANIKATSTNNEVASTTATLRIINLGYAIGGETQREAPAFFVTFPYILRVTDGHIHGVRLVGLVGAALAVGALVLLVLFIKALVKRR